MGAAFRRRLERAEAALARLHPHGVEDMSDRSLCQVIARATGLSVDEVAALTDEQLWALADCPWDDVLRASGIDPGTFAADLVAAGLARPEEGSSL
jgi:hypothetical protein